MTRPVADLVKHLWTGTGNSSPITLGPEAPGFFPFPSTLNNQIISYSIEHVNGAERETGIGTYTHGLVDKTLTRSFVTQSTAGTPLKQLFSAGTKHVRLTALGLDVVENRAITNPGINDDITVGYIEGRSRWLNYQTKQLFFCVDHTAGAALWLQVMAPPFDAGEFDPAAIDLSRGQLEYDSYTQTGAITVALAGEVTPGPGGSVAVNIIGGGFAFNFGTPFVGLDGLTSGTILESGTSYPFFIRFAPDWTQTSPGVFADRVLVGAIGFGSGQLEFGDGDTIEEGPDFLAGGTYTIDPFRARDRFLKVGEPASPLTANMIVALAPTAAGWAGRVGARIEVRKGDTSAFTVTVLGLDTNGLGTSVLRHQHDYAAVLLSSTDAANGPAPGGLKFDLVRRARTATAAEVAAATDAERYVTPASLAAQIAQIATIGAIVPNPWVVWEHKTAIAPGIGTVNVNLSPALEEGDHVFIGMGCDDAIPTYPAGFTPITGGTGGTPGAQLTYKKMGVSPDTSVAISRENSDWIAIVVHVIRGLEAIDGTPTYGFASAGMPIAPEYTTSGSYRLVGVWGVIDDVDVEDVVAPAGFSWLITNHSGHEVAGNDGATVMLAWRLVHEPGTVGSAAFGGSGSDDTDTCTFAFSCSLKAYDFTAPSHLTANVGQFTPGSIDLSRNTQYNEPHVQLGTMAFALSAAAPVSGYGFVLRITGNGAAITYSADFVAADGSSLTAAPYSGFTGDMVVAVDWHGGLGKARVYMEGTGGGGGGGSMSATEIRTALLTVDGAGSGIDADLLDGLDSAFLRARANHTGTQLRATISDLGTAAAADVGAFATTLQGAAADAALARTGGTMTGSLVLGTGASIVGGDKVVSAIELQDVSETAPNAVTGPNGAALSLNYATGSVHRVTTGAGNITAVTVTNWPASGKVGSLTLIITQGAAARTIAWGAAYRFPNGTAFALTPTALVTDIFTLITVDGGAKIFVFEGGKAFPA